jgi:hypothetical protein
MHCCITGTVVSPFLAHKLGYLGLGMALPLYNQRQGSHWKQSIDEEIISQSPNISQALGKA